MAPDCKNLRGEYVVLWCGCSTKGCRQWLSLDNISSDGYDHFNIYPGSIMPHPKKEIAAAIEYALSNGWRVVEGGSHAWVRCIAPTTTKNADAVNFAERVSGAPQKTQVTMQSNFAG